MLAFVACLWPQVFARHLTHNFFVNLSGVELSICLIYPTLGLDSFSLREGIFFFAVNSCSGAVWRVESPQRIESLCTDSRLAAARPAASKSSAVNDPKVSVVHWCWTELMRSLVNDVSMRDPVATWEPPHNLPNHKPMISITVGSDPPQDTLENIHSNRFL